MPTFNRRGISGKGDSLVTKHNATLCGKRNVARVMNTFPPEFDTGNVLNNTQLSNRVYNQLKLHSYAEEKRMNRLHDKVEKATANLAFDPKTRLILYKSLNACILNEIGSIIATGKESIVLYGKGGQSEQHEMPSEVAIKV
jgi:RIO kinase 3